jgi:hypothetical protein
MLLEWCLSKEKSRAVCPALSSSSVINRYR